MLTHFPSLAASKMESTSSAASVQKLRDMYTSRFPKFRRDEIKVKLFAHPLDLAVEDSHDDCQMGFIELLADMDIRSG